MPGGYLVQTGTLIVCPHGGLVQLTSSNTRVLAMATLITAPLPLQVIQPCSLAASGGQCTALNVLVPTTRVLANGSPLFAYTPEPTTMSAGPSPGPGQAGSFQTRVWGM